MYDWDFSWVRTYSRELKSGLLMTLLLNGAVLSFGGTVGLVLGVFSRKANRVVEVLYQLFVDFFRALPILVGLVWAYYCLPIISPALRLNGFWVAVLVLGLNLSAFIAEIVRAGLKEAEENWLESSKVLGLSGRDINQKILLPIVWRTMLPPLTGQVINTVKLSVLASLVAVPELMHQIQDIISQTYRPLEFYTLLAIFFLIILLPPTWWSRKMEQRENKSRMRGDS